MVMLNAETHACGILCIIAPVIKLLDVDSKSRFLSMQFFKICCQLLGASPPDPHRGSAPGPRWGTSVPQTP